jgi:signal transduction histidine kinase/ligand-binding sensor domain-containing protein
MRHSILITVFFFCLSLSGSVLFAQSQEREPLYFQTYTIQDGLSDNFVRDITQDQQGYIWLATGAGVSRFDGYEFEIFRNDPADSTTLSGNDVWAIHTDRKNNVWIATEAGINRLDRSSLTFRRYPVVTGAYISLPVNIIGRFTKFYESDTGTLYIGTAKGLAVYDDKQKEFRMITADEEEGSALSHSEVTSITESADGRLWIGTHGGGINILNPETGAITWLRHDPDDINTLPNDYIFNLFIDQNQVLWVNYDRRENQLGSLFNENIISGSPSGLWKKDLNTGSVKHYLYNPESGHPSWRFITHFEQTQDKKIWMSQVLAVEGALRVYDDKRNTFSTYTYDVNNPGSPPWNWATSLLEDRSGHLWLGTSRGLARADRSQIRMNAFTPDPADRYNLINNFYGIEETGLNQFLISGDGDGTIFWNRDTNTWKDISDIILPAQIPLVYDGISHAWLLSVENIIERVHLETWEKQQYDLNESTGGRVRINHFLRLSDEVILIATREGLWELSQSTGQFTKIDLSVPFPAADGSDIIYLADDSTGKVWLGINNAYLDASNSKKGILIARYDPISGETVFPDINDSYLSALGNGALNHLMTDSRGKVWVSKSNGLVRFDPETNHATFYNAQDGLQHLYVLGTLEDNLGMIWISTEYRISRLNPVTGSIRNFGRNDGLRPARMNAHSFYKRVNGELMFGGVGGLSYFNPEDIRESEEPPLISLVRLEYGDVTVNLTGALAAQASVDIDWGTNSVSLEFVSVNFRNPGETTYSYKLEGFHNDWVDAGTRRFTQFSNLPPKNYTFHVKAVNADGLTSAQAASVSFTVLPPWWRTWWAYGFYLMLLIAGIITVDRIQRRRVQQKERERAREKELAQAKEIEKAYQNLEVAHENLKSAQDQLVQQEKLASLGQLTAGIAHEIKNPLNFVNNFSEVSSELIDEVFEELEKLDDSDAKAEIIAILNDVKGNLIKVHEHGTRADGIVKSMLQHSRGGSGKMEPTDLNTLIKEYTNLAFHGMRAGKNPINVTIDLQLDEEIKTVPLVEEDFSRALLNICNNAFDAMRDKVKITSDKDLTGFQNLSGLLDYQPKLTIRTKSDKDRVAIEVEDNGPGIPEAIKDKILQPFFTTKKGTEGTGLGLSITNDIIKAHGGSLDIESSAKGSIFKIYIPK